MKRTLAAGAALATLPLLTAATPAPAQPLVRESMTLAAAVDALPLAAENRAGYQRTSFRHWIDEDRDGCSTRNEVLIAESRTPVEKGDRCKIVSGEWHSYYDQQTVLGRRPLHLPRRLGGHQTPLGAHRRPYGGEDPPRAGRRLRAAARPIRTRPGLTPPPYRSRPAAPGAGREPGPGDQWNCGWRSD